MLTTRPSPPSISSRSSASKATSVQEKKKELPSEIQGVLKAFSVAQRAQQAYSAPFGEKSRLSIVCPVFSVCSELTLITPHLLDRNRDYQSSLELSVSVHSGTEWSCYTGTEWSCCLQSEIRAAGRRFSPKKLKE